MIPVLFPPGTKDFTTNGLGRLAECTRFEVTEERNGIYECEFEYPQTGKLFDQIIEGALVFATHDDSKEPQPFEIYSRTAPIEGVATFRAWHISYALNNTILKPFTANSITAAFAAIPSNCITNCEFEFWTDKSVAANFTVDVPKSVRAALGGSQGSILDVYGKGDYEFDMFTVKLWANRGTDRGVSIRYGKNLVSLDQQLDASNQYNGYVPYWAGGDGGEVVYLDHAVYGNTQINTEGTLEVRSLEPIQTHTPADILVRYGTTRVIPLDLSSYFQSKPTKAELQARAQALISNSDAYEVKENISIDFVQLWQTEEYKDVANLQRVFLCDTVHIYYSKLGIDATAKCIKVVYDTLRDRYISMELGAPTTSLGDQVADIVNTATKDLPTRSSMIDAIQSATELITGGFGGYIKYTYLADGTPSEMLIMDSPDEATATNIIRLNQNGLGFSTDGGATYGNAWTIDGRLNADYITTGTLDASRIAAHSISVGQLTGSIENGDWSIDLDAGTLTIGKIAVGSITGTINTNGWGVNFNTGTMNIGTLAVGNITGRIETGSWGINFDTGTMQIGTLAVGSITGNIANGNWKIDFDNGTMSIGDISASNITAGTLNVDNITMSGTIRDTGNKNYWNFTTGELIATNGTIGGWELTTNGLSAVNGVYSTDIFHSMIQLEGMYPNFGLRSILTNGNLSMSIYETGTWTERLEIGLDVNETYAFLNNLRLNYDGSVTVADDLNVTGLLSVNKYIYQKIVLSAGASTTVNFGSVAGYRSAIIVGTVGGTGGVVLGVTVNATTITARNLMTNAAWTGAGLQFSISTSGGDITLRNSSSAGTQITIYAG